MTSQGHVTPSVTWLFNSQLVISYRRSIVTKALSPAIFEILGTKLVWVTTLTFQGHVASSVTWPIDSHVAISYRCSIVIKSLSAAVSEILGTVHIGVTTLIFQGHVTVIGHVTIELGMGHFLLVVFWTQVSNSNGFRDILPQTSCAHRHNAESSLRAYIIM